MIIEKLQKVLFPPFCVSYIMSLPIDSCTKLGMIQEAVIEAVIKARGRWAGAGEAQRLGLCSRSNNLSVTKHSKSHEMKKSHRLLKIRIGTWS